MEADFEREIPSPRGKLKVLLTIKFLTLKKFHLFISTHF